MKLCIECDRHLFGPEPACPFCGSAQPTTPARLGPVAAVTLALGLSFAACGPQVGLDSDGSSADDSGTTDPGGTTVMTTVAMTSTSTTTTSASTTSTDDGTTVANDTVDDSQDDAPCAFYAGCPPDGPLDFECDIFAQDCPSGEKCMPWANDGGNVWNATRCAPVADSPDGVDEPCSVEGSPFSGIDSCDLGLMCFGVDLATNEGLCSAMCTGDDSNPICPDGRACSISNDGALVLCADVCDPLAQDCSDGSGCHATQEGDFFVCLPTSDPGTWGDACDAIGDCDAGSLCISGEVIPGCPGSSCCTPYCDLMMPNTCPDPGLGVVCLPWYEIPPPGYENVGVCGTAV